MVQLKSNKFGDQRDNTVFIFYWDREGKNEIKDWNQIISGVTLSIDYKGKLYFSFLKQLLEKYDVDMEVELGEIQSDKKLTKKEKQEILKKHPKTIRTLDVDKLEGTSTFNIPLPMAFYMGYPNQEFNWIIYIKYWRTDNLKGTVEHLAIDLGSGLFFTAKIKHTTLTTGEITPVLLSLKKTDRAKRNFKVYPKNCKLISNGNVHTIKCDYLAYSFGFKPSISGSESVLMFDKPSNV